MPTSACPPGLPPSIKPGTSRNAVRTFVTPDAVHPLLYKHMPKAEDLKGHFNPQPRKPVAIYAPHFDQQGNPLSRKSIEKHTKYMERVNTPQGPIAFQTSDYSAFGEYRFKPGSNSIKGVQALFAITPAGHYHLQHKDRYE